MGDPSRLKNRGRRVAADTLALFLYSAITGLVTTFTIELLIVGMTLAQWGGIRVLYNILKYPGAYFCGKLTDRVRIYMLGFSESRVHRAVADTIALCLYQKPLYIISALAMGASVRQTGIAVALYVVETLLTGWLYGIILNYVRDRFNRTES